MPSQLPSATITSKQPSIDMGHSPAPFIFEPSQQWLGNDGKWSTFVIRVGNPAQSFYVLPAPAIGAIVLPHQDGCTNNATSQRDCGARRGVMDIDGQPSPGFQTRTSTTYEQKGLFGLELEKRLNIDVTALFGFDEVGLMLPNSGGPMLAQQAVGAIKDDDAFYLGLFGLSPHAINFTNYDDPVPSYLSSLKDKGYIPSHSYGYTAGANYRSPQAYGSLTLGGYDKSRLEPHNLTFQFDGDEDRPLRMNLYKVVSERNGSSHNFLDDNTSIYVELDFTITHFWLPPEICDRFADAFQLRYDNSTNLYLVDDNSHKQLLAQNPNVTFTLGLSTDPSQQVSIVLPYTAFDLQASLPTYENATNYFPIRQGNSTQWTLGRAFMQEAYVIADYESSEFKVHQAKFPAQNKRSIVSIHGQKYVPSQGHRLSRGVIAGIVLVVVLFTGLCILAGWIMMRRNMNKQDRLHEVGTETSSHVFNDKIERPLEIEGVAKAELHAAPIGNELDGIPRVELPCEPAGVGARRISCQQKGPTRDGSQ